MADRNGDSGGGGGVMVLHLQRHVAVVAVIGFLLIGVGAIGCVSFGIAEIVSKDSIFLNDGLGEVLTVLGFYFTVPYLFCIGAFVVTVVEPQCLQLKSPNADALILFALTLICYIAQQIVTNIYLAILVDKVALVVAVFDVAVLALHLYYRFDKPYATMLYTVSYAAKMAIQWNNAYLSTQQTTFGPNGVNVMLFLSIPLIQFPLYIMGTSLPSAANSSSAVGSKPGSKVRVTQRTENSIEGTVVQPDLVTSFTANFNLFLSHLLHSLDIISMYSFAFLPPTSTANQLAAPSQLKVMIIVILVIAFLGNNLSVVHLFYRRENVENAEIIFLPKKFREVSRAVDSADDEGGSQRRRIFQYMLFMLVVCDVPLLLTRLELWRQQYSTLSIFVAKNIKSIADAMIMVVRADHKDEDNSAAAAAGRASTSVRGSRAFSLMQAAAKPQMADGHQSPAMYLR